MSKKITNWTAEAAEMILNYQNDDNLVLPTATGGKLKGLMVDKEHVMNMMENPDHNITKLFMIFGLKNEADGQQSFRIVLCGVDENDKMVIDPSYDYCDPCPLTCADLDAHL
ncbi:hypothetical protein [Croceimicrobium hydrocarbonivorans]|uniref:Uncharacterized protein n=1 Tax=Croceimicrobium hydrocarbonivorans TaxID=2761580 RepID=A0A7H0VEM0_9FLAO|nr:hypothetical protein [Croceimicrobium hydrocarbonivorans]QNR24168.1 hypothetical protein H4K34_17630 [Croceimicrobium hydrocarbonivorans]